MPSKENIRKDAPSAGDAIESLSPSYKGGFVRQRDEYSLNQDAVNKLRILLDEGYSIVAFFADWCGDSRRAIPVLALLEKEIGMDIPCLGGMKKPPYGSKKLWDVPPTPVEVETFKVTSSPTILIFDKDGKEIGRIKTRAKMTSSIEEELVKIIEDSKS
ncbi:MAG: TlpA family protein disulfide reductase [Promethearchaeota archaeon]